MNNAVTVVNKCTVDGADTIAEGIKSKKESEGDTSLVGRSFDLKSAYRQLAVADSSFIEVGSPGCLFCSSYRQTHCFQQYSEPFGAKASVAAFLRCARLLQRIALNLDVIVSCYFDDYVCLAPPCLAPSCDKCFASILDLLGWEYDQTGDKADVMSERVQALGVIVDVSCAAAGVLRVANTEKRRQDIGKQIKAVLRLSKAHWASER